MTRFLKNSGKSSRSHDDRDKHICQCDAVPSVQLSFSRHRDIECVFIVVSLKTQLHINVSWETPQWMSSGLCTDRFHMNVCFQRQWHRHHCRCSVVSLKTHSISVVSQKTHSIWTCLERHHSGCPVVCLKTNFTWTCLHNGVFKHAFTCLLERALDTYPNFITAQSLQMDSEMWIVSYPLWFSQS